MKKLLSGIVIFLFILSLQLKAQQVIDSLAGPESILKVGNKLYVSNLRGCFISELSADGKFIRKKFQKATLNAPKGLAAIGNTLYVTDTSRIVGFNMASGEQVFEFTIPGATFLNDLCTAENNLVVSDSKTNKIHLLNLSDKTTRFLGSIAGANGLTYNRKTKQLFGCGVGPGWNGQGKIYVRKLAAKDTLFTEVKNSPAGFFDGIEFIDDNRLIVDDHNQNGQLFIYDVRSGNSTSYPIHCSPADLYYDKASGKIYIPDLPKNRILVMNLNNLKTN